MANEGQSSTRIRVTRQGSVFPIDTSEVFDVHEDQAIIKKIVRFDSSGSVVAKEDIDDLGYIVLTNKTLGENADIAYDAGFATLIGFLGDGDTFDENADPQPTPIANLPNSFSVCPPPTTKNVYVRCNSGGTVDVEILLLPRP